MAWFRKSVAAPEETRGNRGLPPQEAVEQSFVEFEDESITSATLYGFSKHIPLGDNRAIIREVHEFLGRGGEFKSLVKLAVKLGMELADKAQRDTQVDGALSTFDDHVLTQSDVWYVERNAIDFFARQMSEVSVIYALPGDPDDVRILSGKPYEVSDEAIYLEVSAADRVIIPLALVKRISKVFGNIDEQFVLRLSLTEDEGILCDVTPIVEDEDAFKGLERDEREDRNRTVQNPRSTKEFSYAKISYTSPFELREIVGRKIYFEVFEYRDDGTMSICCTGAATIKAVDSHSGDGNERSLSRKVRLISSEENFTINFDHLIRYFFLDED